jgi:hypothetical protein
MRRHAITFDISPVESVEKRAGTLRSAALRRGNRRSELFEGMGRNSHFVAGLFGEGAQIAFLSGTGLVGGGYPAIQRCGLSQLNPSRQTPRKRAFSCGRVLVYSKYTSKGTGMPYRELLTEPQRVSFHAPASDEREMVEELRLTRRFTYVHLFSPYVTSHPSPFDGSFTTKVFRRQPHPAVLKAPSNKASLPSSSIPHRDSRVLDTLG